MRVVNCRLSVVACILGFLPGCGSEWGSPDGNEDGSCESDGTCDMVVVSSGSFMMGCNVAVDEDCSDSEKPYHEVDVPSFKIDTHEVTVAAYRACVNAGACTDYQCDQSGDAHPVSCVDWNQSKEFCTWAGRRLCSEAEWEKAARGTDGRRFPWGNQTASCQYAVMAESADGSQPGCGTGSSMSVGSKPAGASPCGAMDMAGNVREWVEDYWHDEYAGAPADGTAWVDPSDTHRVVRGCSYDCGGDDFLRSSSRDSENPSFAEYYIGVRCCKSLPVASQRKN